MTEHEPLARYRCYLRRYYDWHTKVFHRPMNRTVHTQIKSIMPENTRPDPVFLGGGTRPNNR